MWAATAVWLNPPDPRCSFGRPARGTAASGVTAARLGPGPRPPGADGPGHPPPLGGIRDRLVPVPLSRMAGRPFPLPRRGLFGPPFKSFCAGQRRCPRKASADHVRAGPVARAGSGPVPPGVLAGARIGRGRIERGRRPPGGRVRGE